MSNKTEPKKEKDIDPFEDGIYDYKVMHETHHLANATANHLYGIAPKKKVSRKDFFDYSRLSYQMGSCNNLVATVDFLKRSFKEEWTHDEILGALQIALKTNWDLMCKNKVGMGTFKKLEMDSIITAENATEYLRGGVKC